MLSKFEEIYNKGLEYTFNFMFDAIKLAVENCEIYHCDRYRRIFTDDVLKEYAIEVVEKQLEDRNGKH